jgi:hypothetical protein
MKPRWTIIVLALSLAVAGTAPLASARAADCYTICQQNCSSPGLATYDQNFCRAREQRCQQQCNARSAPHGTYGAIAYGAGSIAFGYAFDKDSADDAKKTALANCRQHGIDCKIVTNFSKACAAVAAVESKGVFTVAQSSSSGEAEKDAMSACSRRYGGGCEIEVWTCSQ